MNQNIWGKMKPLLAFAVDFQKRVLQSPIKLSHHTHIGEWDHSKWKFYCKLWNIEYWQGAVSKMFESFQWGSYSERVGQKQKSLHPRSQQRVGHISHYMEKEMATHSSVLAWRIPGMGEPGGLPYGVTQSWTWLKRLSSSSSRPTPTINILK